MHFLSKIIQLLFLLLLWKISAYGSAKNQSITGIFQELYFSDYLYLKITQKNGQTLGFYCNIPLLLGIGVIYSLKNLIDFKRLKKSLASKFQTSWQNSITINPKIRS